MTQSRHLSAIGVSLSLSAHAQTYPSVVQVEIRDATIKLPKDFVTRKDVNGDGVQSHLTRRPSRNSWRCPGSPSSRSWGLSTR